MRFLEPADKIRFFVAHGVLNCREEIATDDENENGNGIISGIMVNMSSCVLSISAFELTGILFL